MPGENQTFFQKYKLWIFIAAVVFAIALVVVIIVVSSKKGTASEEPDPEDYLLLEEGLYLRESNSDAAIIKDRSPFTIEFDLVPQSNGPLLSFVQAKTSSLPPTTTYQTVIAIGLLEDSTLQFGRQGSELISTTPIEKDTRNKLKFIYDGDAMKIFINDTLRGTMNATNNIDNINPTIRIGAFVDFNNFILPGLFLKATLFSFKIWTNATGSGVPDTFYDFKVTDTTGPGSTFTNQGLRISQIELVQA